MKELLIALALICQFSVLCNGRIPAQSQQTSPQNPTPRETQIPARPTEDDVVRITTNLVQVDPVILDSKGKPVTDLRADEIQILEDGKPQPITNFSYIAFDAPVISRAVKPDKNAPPVPPIRLKPEDVSRTIALVVDDLGLSFESTYYVREALKKFLDQQMQPKDLVAIVRTSGGVGALQQFTTDKRQLYAALEKIRWKPYSLGGISAFAPISDEPGARTSRLNTENSLTSSEIDPDQFRADLYTVGTLGAVTYIVRGLRELPGRKSIILFSDGISVFSSTQPHRDLRVTNAIQTLTEMANRASVVINTIDARGLPTLGFQAADSAGGMTPPALQQMLSARSSDFFDSQSGLNWLARQTGGLAIRNSNDLSGGIRTIIQDQAGYYLIGYRPDESTFDSSSSKRKFHRLTLKVLRPGKFTVRMRNGFYGITDEEAKPSIRGIDPIVAALISPFGSSGINVRLTSLFANDAKIGSFMRSMLHVKASDLTFKETADGWHTSEFDILAYTFGDNGTVVDHMGRTHSIRVKGKSYERIIKNGFTYNLTVPIKKPGSYQLRTALRDKASKRIGSATQYIEVPDVKKKRLSLSGIVLTGLTQEAYKKGENGFVAPRDNSDDTVDETDPKASPAVRQFKPNLILVYGYQIYNARSDKTNKQPQVQTRVRLFRNGEEVFSGKEVPFDSSKESDLKRLSMTGAIQLGNEMPSGEYVLQVIVTDLMETGKHRVSSQWVDFDVVK